jgi:hypothetical protein
LRMRHRKQWQRLVPQAPNPRLQIPSKELIPNLKMEHGANPRDLEDCTIQFAECVWTFVKRLSTRYGERRLLACGRRQLADDTRAVANNAGFKRPKSFSASCRKDRLAACAPQIGAFRKPK